MYRGTFTRDTMQALALRLFPDLDVPAIITGLSRAVKRRPRQRRHGKPTPERGKLTLVTIAPTMPVIRHWIEMEMLRRALHEDPRARFDAHAAFDEEMLKLKRRQHAAYTSEYRRAQTQARQRAYEQDLPGTSTKKWQLGEQRLKRESAAIAADLDSWFASVCAAAHRDEHGDADE